MTADMTEQPQPVTIERMTYEDIPQVHRLEKLCFTAPWDISAYYRDFRNPSAFYQVARLAGRIVGFGGVWIIEDEAHIVTMAVQQEYRCRGIGRLLMDALLEEARRRHVAIVTLEVRVHNAPAQHLYTKLGFHTIAYRRHYYPDNNEDAAVMELRLDQ